MTPDPRSEQAGVTSSRKLPCRKKAPRRPCTAVEAALRRLCGEGCRFSPPLPALPGARCPVPGAWACLVCDARARSTVAFERCSARWLHTTIISATALAAMQTPLKDLAQQAGLSRQV